MFRYIGNKSKLLPVIMQVTQENIGPTGTVVDLMSGTGSVALEYRRRGYHVIASDMMTYSKCHLVSQLLYDAPPLFYGLGSEQESFFDAPNRYERVLKYLNSLEPVNGYFYQEFSPEGKPANGCPSRKYFTPSNAAKIDAVREQIREWTERKLISDNESAVLKHTLIMAVNKIAT